MTSPTTSSLPPVSLNVPDISGREWEYVRECLDTGWVSSAGPFVDRFERELAVYVGAPHAVATVSGTAALHAALLVAGVRADDEVLVPALTFIAPANAVRYVGAWPVFMDAEAAHWQMDVDKVATFLARECEATPTGLRNRATKRRVSAVLPVHVHGHPVDMEPLVAVARRFGLVVVEDATESLGSEYRGRKTGLLGDIGCFSFNGNKIITTGGGGMIVTADAALAKRARYLTNQAKDDPIEYVHNEVGYNYRLTNVQAAIGVAQLERLDEYVARKREIASAYQRALGVVPGLSFAPEASWARSNCWLITMLVDATVAGVTSRQLMARLQHARIETRPFWHPLNTLPPFRACQSYQVEVVERLYRDGLSLPSSASLAPADQARVIAAVAEALAARAGA